MMGFLNGSGISWTICKQSSPRSRQTTTPTPHHSIFTGRMLFLTLNRQCQSTEDSTVHTLALALTNANWSVVILDWQKYFVRNKNLYHKL